MDKNIHEDLAAICELERQFTDAVKTVVGHGIFSQDVDSKELGDLVDMAKDVVEMKEKCWKAKYYETVVNAMEKAEEDQVRYGAPMSAGYDHWHYANGRFAPKGRGHRVMGYIPFDDEMMEDPTRMGYTRNQTGSRMSEGPSHNIGRYGYPDDRYGSSYHEYQNALRHYTETKSADDKAMMESHGRDHLRNTIYSLKEMWKTSDPAMRKQIKSELSSLVGEMPV